MTRRELLRLGGTSIIGGWLYGCGRCDAGFPPNLTMPVFYGYKDYVVNKPIARVFYPSIEGTPAGASILTNCEPFPLVLLIHGDCHDGVPYNQWLYCAAQLARAGYVVAVTFAGGFLATGNLQETVDLQGVHTYMRSEWEYRDTLMASPNTAVIGHSFGGTVAAELATQIPIMAFVSLSGTFGQVTSNPQAILQGIHGPSLFVWNTNDDPGLDAEMFRPDLPPAGQFWSLIGTPKHAVRIIGGAHGDYLTSGTSTNCAQGTCNLVRPLSVDLTTTFLTKYMPPGGLTGIASLVPDSLFVRPQDLPPPPANGFYAGSYLQGLASSKQTSGAPDSTKQPCFEQIFWQTNASQGSTYLIPL
jgi:hypothetical protein